MPINIKKGYNFAPKFTAGEVPACRMDVRDSLYSRKHVGGMFFRSADRGRSANLISLKFEEIDVLVRRAGSSDPGVPLDQITPETDINGVAKLLEVVSGMARLTVKSPMMTMSSFTGIGNGKIGSIVVVAEPPEKEYVFTATSPSLFINPLLGTATVGTPFKSPYLAFMINRGGTPFQVGDKFTIKISGGTERHEVPARLNTYTTTITTTTTTTTTTPDVTDPLTGAVTPGSTSSSSSSSSTPTETNVPGTNTDGTPSVANLNPSIAELRLKVNANSKVITMPERGVDRTDEDQEDFGYTLFTETLMEGGDGLPANAVGIKTGPDRAFCFINYSENLSGQFTVIANVFEWVGDDEYNGVWSVYS